MNHERAKAEAETIALVAKSPPRKKKAGSTSADGAALFGSGDAEVIGEGNAVLFALALLYTWNKPADRRSFEMGMILMQRDSLRQRVLKKSVAATSAAPTTPFSLGNMDEFLGELSGSKTLVVETTKVRQLVRLGSDAPAKALLTESTHGQQVFATAVEAVRAIAILDEQSKSLYEYMGAGDYGPIELAIS